MANGNLFDRFFHVKVHVVLPCFHEAQPLIESRCGVFLEHLQFHFCVRGAASFEKTAQQNSPMPRFLCAGSREMSTNVVALSPVSTIIRPMGAASSSTIWCSAPGYAVAYHCCWAANCMCKNVSNWATLQPSPENSSSRVLA